MLTTGHEDHHRWRVPYLLKLRLDIPHRFQVHPRLFAAEAKENTVINRRSSRSRTRQLMVGLFNHSERHVPIPDALAVPAALCRFAHRHRRHRFPTSCRSNLPASPGSKGIWQLGEKGVGPPLMMDFTNAEVPLRPSRDDGPALIQCLHRPGAGKASSGLFQPRALRAAGRECRSAKYIRKVVRSSTFHATATCPSQQHLGCPRSFEDTIVT